MEGGVFDMASQRRLLKVTLVIAAAVAGLIPAITVQAGENGPFIQPVYAPIIGGGPGTPLSSPYAVQPAPLNSGPGFLVPNATNTGYVNPLIPTQPRPAPRSNPVLPYQPTNTSSNLAASGSVSVSMPTGWDLVGGPAGTVITGNTGPLYTYQGGDTAYETIPSGSTLTAGEGYWAYFGGPTTGSIPLASGQSITVQVPANHFVMIGNPGSGTATVTGVDSVLVYNAASGQFQAATSLAPGQGAWVWSASGGTATVQSS